MARGGDTESLLRHRPELLTRERLGAVAPLLAVLGLAVAVKVWPYSAPWGITLDGALAGGRIALIALGIALVYRANRIVNFAAGDLGQLPVTIVVILVLSLGWNYYLGTAVGLAAAVVLGILVETLVIRRFFRAPRLILTVATIGIAQVLTGFSLWLVTRVEPTSFSSDRLTPPFKVRFELGGTVFNAVDVLTMVTIPIAFVALALWLTRSNVGIAVRASAERADRAATLGIPVRRLHTIVWTVATVLAFLGIWLRAGAVGLPIGDPTKPGSVLGPLFLLQALAAVIIGRMERFTVIAGAAIGLGILDRAITYTHANRPDYLSLVLFVVVLAVLLLAPRPARGRSDADQISTWQSVREVRPVPRELRDLPEVRALRWVPPVLVAVALVTLPAWLSESRLDLATLIVLFGIVGASLVVLTGWTGQVSLGQMGFVGLGAAVGGGVTDHLGWDLSLAVIVSGIAGALTAAVIGFPALRRRGLTLAVSTLAFALFISEYALNRSVFTDRLPGFRIDRPDLFGAVDISTETRFYYLSLATLGLALLVVHGLRRARPGRVLIGIRENERAVRSYGVDATRTALAAFAVSGFLAALAGALYVHQQTGLHPEPYLPAQSLKVFTIVVIGGLGSVPGVLLGAAYVQGADYFLPGQWQLLASGGGLLLVLMILPGGLGSLLYDGRDWILRQVARRRRLLVPSLVADRRVDGTPQFEPELTTAAETIERESVPEAVP